MDIAVEGPELMQVLNLALAQNSWNQEHGVDPSKQLPIVVDAVVDVGGGMPVEPLPDGSDDITMNDFGKYGEPDSSSKPGEMVDSQASKVITNNSNFASQDLAKSHFDEHGAELGYKTEGEYLKGARSLFSGGDGIDSFTRKSDGATVFSNKNTGEFGVLNKDGTIGTYMLPDNLYDYYLQQEAENSQ